VSRLRRIFTAPGNPRIWVSLVIYGSALAALLVYRDKIGRVVATGFQNLTGPPAPPLKPPSKADADAAAAARAKALPVPQRHLELLALARGGNAVALQALAVELDSPAAAHPPPALGAAAASALDEGDRPLRRVAARIVLAAEGIPPTKAAAKALAADLGPKAPKPRRLQALGRLGLLGLTGARSATSERALSHCLADADPAVRGAAARALGRIADAASRDRLLRFLQEREPAEVRDSALAGLTDLALADQARRTGVLRRLTAKLADKDATGELAEQIWRTVRRLGALPAPKP